MYYLIYNVSMKFCYFSVFERCDQHLAKKQARALLEAGYKVNMVFADGLADDIEDGLHLSSIPLKSNIGSYIKRLVLYPFFFYKKLKEIDADVYQCCDVDLLLICLILKKRGKSVVFNLLEEHPYTLYSKLKFPKFINTFIVWLVSKWMRFVLKRLDCVFTVAPDIVNYLQEWGVKNITIIGNYPEINKDYILTEEEYLQREDRIIYFGAIYGISCQKELLDALVSLDKPIKYLLAGDFGVGEDYKSMLQKHVGWNQVEFINRFPKNELKNLIARSTISNVLRDFQVTFYSSGSYGIIKLFESMEAALPLICPDVPVYRDLMKEYPCGILVNPKDPKEIANAIEFLINNKREAYQMGQIGRKAVMQQYSWDIEKKRYLSIINGEKQH